MNFDPLAGNYDDEAEPGSILRPVPARPRPLPPNKIHQLQERVSALERKWASIPIVEPPACSTPDKSAELIKALEEQLVTARKAMQMWDECAREADRKANQVTKVLQNLNSMSFLAFLFRGRKLIRKACEQK